MNTIVAKSVKSRREKNGIGTSKKWRIEKNGKKKIDADANMT